jgi:hypothetical protein
MKKQENINTIPDLLSALRSGNHPLDVVKWREKYIIPFRNAELEVKASVVAKAVAAGLIAETKPGENEESWTLPEFVDWFDYSKPHPPRKRGRPRSENSAS